MVTVKKRPKKRGKDKLGTTQQGRKKRDAGNQTGEERATGKQSLGHPSLSKKKSEKILKNGPVQTSPSPEKR